jgi:hypothetical protein
MAAVAIERLTDNAPEGLFPLGKEVVSGVFNELEQTGKGFEGLVGMEEEIMDSDNQEALNYLQSLVSTFEPNSRRGFRIGISMAYRVIGKRIKGGVVPSLLPEFVDRYDLVRENTLGIDMEDDDYIKTSEDGHIMKLNLFRLMERDLYKGLEEQILADRKDVSLLESPIYAGFVYTYFLFREGLSDPANLAPRLH